MVAPQVKGLTAGSYRSYLVRLWRSNPHSPLRASALCVQSGALTHFADLPSLFAFLESFDDPPVVAEPPQR